MSPIESALSSLRISGTVLLHERYAPGTAISVPGERQLRALLGYGPHVKVAPFHLVLRGGFDLVMNERERHALGERDVAMCLNGSAHQLRFGTAEAVVPLEDVLTKRVHPQPMSPSEGTELICGVFAMQSLPLSPLLAALPDVLRGNTRSDGAAPLLSQVTQMLQRVLESPTRTGDNFARARLLELIFSEAIRAYQASEPAPAGWFRGLTDARISMALTAFHREPAEAWSVKRLAACCNLSPSRFAARFHDALGQTAMEYVARWRIHLASRLLDDAGNTLDSIALSVGYGGGAALSKAFKDRVGCSPTLWRAGRQSAPSA